MSSSSSSSMNKYWISHQDIHKKVITAEIQFHLGPQASVRPFTKDGEDGFLITTPGPCLSDEQIDDICIKSKEMWERQAAARSSGSPDKPLKRPLHQPVVISRGGPSGSTTDSWRRRHHDRRGNEHRRRHDDRRRD